MAPRREADRVCQEVHDDLAQLQRHAATDMRQARVDNEGDLESFGLGLRPQDRILRFGDHEVEDFYSLVDLLRNYRPGEVVDTLIQREDSVMPVPITLTGWD